MIKIDRDISVIFAAKKLKEPWKVKAVKMDVEGAACRGGGGVRGAHDLGES